MKTLKRMLAAVLAAAVIFCLPALGGCASDDWGGEWNRTGDATYSRAILEIYDVKASGFCFDMDLYNGNLAGELNSMFAKFTNGEKTAARCDIANSRAYIEFTLEESGNMQVYYGNDLLSEQSVGIIESELFGFEESAFITGQFVRGEVEYINSSLAAGGVLSEEDDELVKDILPDDVYDRLLDCFQTWKIIGTGNNEGAHEDEIGGYVYYGSNTMQEYAAIVIIYDDGTAGVAVSQPDGTLLYYSSNSIYKDGSLTPLPVTRWIENTQKEQAKKNAQ